MPTDFIISGVMAVIGGLGLLLISVLGNSPEVKMTATTVLVVGAASFYFS